MQLMCGLGYSGNQGGQGNPSNADLIQVITGYSGNPRN